MTNVGVMMTDNNAVAVQGNHWWRRCRPNRLAMLTTRYGRATLATTVINVETESVTTQVGVSIEVLDDGSALAYLRIP